MEQRLDKLKSSTSDGLVRNSWVVSFVHCCNVQWQIQYFPLGEGNGAPTPNMGVPTYFLATFPQKLHENEKKIGRGCCDMGQNDTIGKIELNQSFVLSSDNTNCKNDIQLFPQLFDELRVNGDCH